MSRPVVEYVGFAIISIVLVYCLSWFVPLLWKCLQNRPTRGVTYNRLAQPRMFWLGVGSWVFVLALMLVAEYAMVVHLFWLTP